MEDMNDVDCYISYLDEVESLSIEIEKLEQEIDFLEANNGDVFLIEEKKALIAKKKKKVSKLRKIGSGLKKVAKTAGKGVKKTAKGLAKAGDKYKKRKGRPVKKRPTKRVRFLNYDKYICYNCGSIFECNEPVCPNCLTKNTSLC